MSDYTKATNFAIKDGLTTGDAAKRIKGTEIDTEFNAIASAIASKSDSNSPTFTGTPLAPTASSGTSNTQIASTAFVAAAITAAFPSGVILLWSGSVASIPSGWYLCNGSNGTPDLRNKFIVGAGSTYSVGDTGGSADASVVSHTHTYSSTTGSNGDHTHSVYSSTGTQTVPRGIAETNANSVAAINDTNSSGYKTQLTGNSTAPLNTTGAHTHSISGTTASTGSSGTNANLPPYYALAYIMKA